VVVCVGLGELCDDGLNNCEAVVSKCFKLLSKFVVRLSVRDDGLHAQQLCFEKLGSDRMQ
jgi:hypothetical protein